MLTPNLLSLFYWYVERLGLFRPSGEPMTKRKHKNRPAGKHLTLTNKQKVYIGEVVKGSTKKAAALKAGYAPSTNSSNIENENVRNAMVKALDKIGISEEAIARKVNDGLNATESHFYTFEGKVVDSRKTPDYGTRHKYVMTTLELLRYIKNPSIENLNIGLIQIPQAPEKADQWDGDKETQALATTGATIP